MGVFLSINGWSDNVVPRLKQNPDKDIVLMNGYYLRSVLERQLDLHDSLTEKLADLNYRGEPYLSVQEYLQRRRV